MNKQTIVSNSNFHHQQLLRDVLEEWFSKTREMCSFSYNFLMGRVSLKRVSTTFRVIHPCGMSPLWKISSPGDLVKKFVFCVVP